MPYKEYLDQAVEELEAANLLFEEKCIAKLPFLHHNKPTIDKVWSN